jgi:hypothetical protein
MCPNYNWNAVFRTETVTYLDGEVIIRVKKLLTLAAISIRLSSIRRIEDILGFGRIYIIGR